MPASFAEESDFFDMSMSNAPGRTYRYYTGTPLWSFGYGLSYTQFNLSWSNDSLTEQHQLSQRQLQIDFRVTITNIGSREGDEGRIQAPRRYRRGDDEARLWKIY